MATKKFVVESLDSGNILKFYQTLQNYLKLSVGNDVYNFSKYDEIQNTDTTIFNYPNTFVYLPQNWVIKCNDKKTMVKYKILLTEQKQTTQQVIMEQIHYLKSVIVLCILRFHSVFLVMMCLSAGKELILYQLLT